MVAAVYGVLKAGAAYVPLDPTGAEGPARSDRDRLRPRASSRRDAGATSLLPARDRNDLRLAILVGRGGTLTERPTTPSSDSRMRRPFPGRAERDTVDADLAYILYTSGSTGAPKGVMLSHRHALTFVRWWPRPLASDRRTRSRTTRRSTSTCRCSTCTSLRSPVRPSFRSRTSSSTSAPSPSFIERERITAWYSVPSALRCWHARCRAGRTPQAANGRSSPARCSRLKELRRLRELASPSRPLEPLRSDRDERVTYYRVQRLPQDHVPIPDRAGVREHGGVRAP